MKSKAVIYTRVSTDKQADEGTSLEVQESACLRKAQEIGAEVIDILTDEGVSGAFYLSRPGIQRALKLIEEGKANVLVTMKLDRSGRDADVLGLIRKRVVNAGAKLVFADGMNFENNASGNLMFRVNAGFAEYEKEVIRERTMSGRRRRAENGQQPARAQSPLGYHVVTKEDVLRGNYPADQLGRYVVIEDEAAIVRELYRLCASGVSLRQLSMWINAQGVPTQRGGKTWYQSTMRYLLLNPVYIGQPIYGKLCCRTDESRIEKGLKPAYHKPAPDSEQIKLSCDPLVPLATWSLCQDRLQENKERLAGATGRKTLLAGLMRCPACHRAMTSSYNGARRYFHCKANRPSRSVTGIPCLPTTHRVDSLEALVIRDLCLLARKPKRFADAIHTHDLKRRQSEQEDTGGELDRLQADLADLDQRETMTAKAQVEALMKGRSTEVYDGILSEIDTKRKQVLARLAVIAPRQEQRPALDSMSEGEKIAEVLRRLDAVLTSEAIPISEKNGAISTFIKAIWPVDDGYDLQLRLPEGASVQYITMYCRPVLSI